MSARVYAAVTLSGKRVSYPDVAALNRAIRRRKDVIVDHWPANDPPPVNSSSAAEWDAYRARHGYAGGR